MVRTGQPPAKPKAASPKTPKPQANKNKATVDASNLVGKMAPDFTLPDQDGTPVSLKDLRQRGDVVLYFYPKDMTPGCTNEACAFRDKLDLVRGAGAQVVGVSADSPGSHLKFVQKYGLTFPLLSDPANQVTKAYRVYKQKSLYGREFMGIERSTFIIGRNGTVRRVFTKVKVNGHAEEVLAALSERSS
jgi:thioredoxin-dependent peroxiredoxin